MTVLQIRKGAVVSVNGKNVLVADLIDQRQVAIKDPTTNRLDVAKIEEIRPQVVEEVQPDEPPPLVDISPEEWELAQRRASVIMPLADSRRVTRKQAAEAGATLGCCVETIYEYVRRYRQTAEITSLLPRHHRKGGKGKERLDPEVEKIVAEHIDRLFLTPQRLTVQQLLETIEHECKRRGLKPPVRNSVQKRIDARDHREVLLRREGRKVADERTTPMVGKFEARYPLDIIQIDHTKVDVMIVDQEYRRVIGRPQITLAIDVYSRCCTAVYLALHPPSALSAALCIAHSALPKDAWLRELGLGEYEWPVWGLPSRVMVDNAKEFESLAFCRGLGQHRIQMEFRPVGVPRYGGHIESLIGRVVKGTHVLPGTTKSNVAARGAYDSEGNALLTLPELRCIIVAALSQYHREYHDGIGTTPLKKYDEGLFGSNGRGLPPLIMDEQRFLIDFLPHTDRTVQDYGLRLFRIHYFSDVLRRWIGRPDSGKRKFRVAYDPRNLRVVYFYDPEVRQYFEIPTRNRFRPDFSLWELQAAREQALREGRANVDEDALFDLVEYQRKVLLGAAEKTKKARRIAERERHNRLQKGRTGQAALPAPSNSKDQEANGHDGPAAEMEHTEKFSELEDWQ